MNRMRWLLLRWKYRLLVWAVDKPDALARRVRIETRLSNVAAGKRPPPTPEECREWANELGVPTWAKRR